MSLTTFIQKDDVKAQLSSIIPPIPRLRDLPIIAPSRSQNWSLVGTAFDYALRFELQRLNPHAIVRSWIAEGAVEGLWASVDDHRLRVMADEVVDDARSAIEHFVELREASEPIRREIAAHAIRLARLDVFARCGRIDPDLNSVDSNDVDDVCRLLEIAPLEELGGSDPLLLNPSFGKWSRAVGGADADIIAGDTLIELKVTKAVDVAAHIHQLLGYLLLARAARRGDTAFPEIRAIAVYFARHAHLCRIPVESIVAKSRFPAVEAWFVDRLLSRTRQLSLTSISSNTGLNTSVSASDGSAFRPGLCPGGLTRASDSESEEFSVCPGDADCRGRHDDTVGCCPHRCVYIHELRGAAEGEPGTALRATYAFTGVRLRCGCRQRAFIWLSDGYQIVECLFCGATWIGSPLEP